MDLTFKFKYETHMHTREASTCGLVSGAEMAEWYSRLGYSGIIITDHFFNGNSCVPRRLPWQKRVELFCRGYENAFQKGRELGLAVFFGWEYNDHATEFLTYGLDKDWLLAHPDMLEWDLERYFHEIHAAGGFLSHAHPFREAPYIPQIRLFPNDVDAVEAVNTSHRNPLFNERAKEYARRHQLPMTCGSDAHFTDRSGWGGMAFDHELTSIGDFIQSVRAGDYILSEE